MTSKVAYLYMPCGDREARGYFAAIRLSNGAQMYAKREFRNHYGQCWGLDIEFFQSIADGGASIHTNFASDAEPKSLLIGRYQMAFESFDEEDRKAELGRHQALAPAFHEAFGGDWKRVLGDEHLPKLLSIDNDFLRLSGSKGIVGGFRQGYTPNEKEFSASVDLDEDHFMNATLRPSLDDAECTWRMEYTVYRTINSTVESRAVYERTIESIEEDVTRTDAAIKRIEVYDGMSE